jgi:hypothetical protein
MKIRLQTYKINEPLPASPMTAMPVAAMPVAAMPAPVTAVPVPVPVAPAYFLRFDAINLFLRGDSRLCALAVRGRQGLFGQYRRQRGCVRASRKSRSAGGKTKSNFYKVTAFHDISLLVHSK